MRAGDVLADRFELIRLIGHGGNGHVWRSRDTVLDREVAVKVLDIGDAEETVHRRFQLEARAAAALVHPHVVSVHDAGVDGSKAFLVMELLPGPTLAAMVRQDGQLRPMRAIDLAAQAASGLAAVHAAGIVHRDVKPGNLVLDRLGQVKVVDFGIASVAEAAGTQLTAAGTLVGSVNYLSPEQARGEPATPASDHYGLGCTLMTLLTGEPPFSAEHPMAVLRQHLSVVPIRVRARRPDVPEWIDQLVDDLLAKDPERRAVGFRTLLDHSDVGAPPTDDATGPTPGPAGTRVLTAASGSGPTAIPPPPPYPPSASGSHPTPAPVSPYAHRGTPRPPSTPWIVAAALVVVAMLLGTFVLVAAMSDNDAPDEQTVAADVGDATVSAASPSEGDVDGGSEGSVDSRTTAEEPVATAPVSLAQATADLRSAVNTAAQGGEVRGKSIEELDSALDDLDRVVFEGKPGPKAKKALDDLVKAIEKGTQKGRITAPAAQRLLAAVEVVRKAAPRGPGPARP